MCFGNRRVLRIAEKGIRSLINYTVFLFLAALLPLAGNILAKNMFMAKPAPERMASNILVSPNDLTLCYSVPLVFISSAVLFLERLFSDGVIAVSDLPKFELLGLDEIQLMMMATFGFCLPVLYTNACAKKDMDLATLDYGGAIRPLEIFLFSLFLSAIGLLDEPESGTGPKQLYAIGIAICFISFCGLIYQQSKKQRGFCDPKAS